MKKFLIAFTACILGTAASAADMQFVTVLSQPVGSFQSVDVSGTDPVQAEKIIFGANAKLDLAKGALIYKAKGKKFSSNASLYVNNASLNGGYWESLGKTHVAIWRDTDQSVAAQTVFDDNEDGGTFVVRGQNIVVSTADFERMTLNGSAFFPNPNGEILRPSSSTKCSWEPTYSSNGSLLLECK